MRLGTTARMAAVLTLSIGGIISACRNDVPGPAIPSPVTPEVTRQAPKPKPIEPTKHKPRKIRVSEAAHAAHDVPVDAGVSDVIDLPPVPDASVAIVRDAGQPLK